MSGQQDGDENISFKKFVRIQQLHDKPYLCSGFKRIGKDRIVYDFDNNQLQFMFQDSIYPLEP